jgi:hypothetical protein
MNMAGWETAKAWSQSYDLELQRQRSKNLQRNE